MHRLVLDTNVRLSSAVFGGRPQQVDQICQPPDFLQIISPTLLRELEDKLRVRFLWTEAQLNIELARVLASSMLVKPESRIRVCRDPDDDRILECAVDGSAELIVTGDIDLLSLGGFQGIRIMTPRQFMDQFGQTASNLSRLP